MAIEGDDDAQLAMCFHLFQLLIGAFSVLILPPAWIFFSASLCAYLANRAVLNVIQSLAAG